MLVQRLCVLELHLAVDCRGFILCVNHSFYQE